MAQRPNELTPHASPRHFWGAELRARRTAKGMSLDALGKLVYRDRSYLAKIEKGERNIPEDLARACDQAVDAGGTLIRLHALIMSPESDHVAKVGPDVAKPAQPVATEPEEPAPFEEGEQVSVPARTADGRVIFVSVSRRLFVTGVAGAAVSTALPQPTPGVPALTAGLRVQSSDMLTTAPDLHPVDHLERLRTVLIDSDNLWGPEQVIPTVTQHVKLIQRLRQGKRGADMRALLKMQAKYAEFAAWLHQDYGDHVGADHWTSRALEWSQGAGDVELTAFILSRGSQLAGDMGDSERAIDLAAAAESMASPHSRLAAIGATFAGQGHALRHDAYETHRAYDHARELLASLDDDPRSPWGAWLDPAYIAVQESRSLVVVGEYAAAAEGFHKAIAALPPDFHRDRGVYLARAARAYAGMQEVDHASKIGMESLAIGLQTKSGRILTELSALNDMLDRWHTPAVSEFSQAMAESIGRQVR